MRKIGVVLGGGGIRSMAHIGVLSELIRLGVPIHRVAGTSAGAIIAALFAAGMPLPEIEAQARGVVWHSLFEPSLLWRRAIKGERLMRFLQRLLGTCQTFEACQVGLTITAVDLVAGRLVEFDQGPLVPAIRASVALPGAFQPVYSADGRLLVDGGILSNVPTETLRSAGCDVVIAVDVRSAWAPHLGLWRRWSTKDIILRVGEVMNCYITDQALAHADVLIRPEVTGVGVFDVKQIGVCIDAGVQAVQAVSDQLGQLMEAYHPVQPEPHRNGRPLTAPALQGV